MQDFPGGRLCGWRFSQEVEYVCGGFPRREIVQVEVWTFWRDYPDWRVWTNWKHAFQLSPAFPLSVRTPPYIKVSLSAKSMII